MLILYVGLTLNGQSVSLDTDTTLVGCPADSISAVYGHIPGSEALIGNNAGYYSYRELRPHPAMPIV